MSRSFPAKSVLLPNMERARLTVWMYYKALILIFNSEDFNSRKARRWLRLSESGLNAVYGAGIRNQAFVSLFGRMTTREGQAQMTGDFLAAALDSYQTNIHVYTLQWIKLPSQKKPTIWQ